MTQPDHLIPLPVLLRFAVPLVVLVGTSIGFACDRATASASPGSAASPLSDDSPPPAERLPKASAGGSSVGGPPAMESVRDADFAGAVLEVLPAGGYTYLRVAREPSDAVGVWVVTMSSIPAARRVSVTPVGHRRDFYSKRLQRRFDSVLFSVVRVLEPTP